MPLDGIERMTKKTRTKAPTLVPENQEAWPVATVHEIAVTVKHVYIMQAMRSTITDPEKIRRVKRTKTSCTCWAWSIHHLWQSGLLRSSKPPKSSVFVWPSLLTPLRRNSAVFWMTERAHVDDKIGPWKSHLVEHDISQACILYFWWERLHLEFDTMNIMN